MFTMSQNKILACIINTSCLALAISAFASAVQATTDTKPTKLPKITLSATQIAEKNAAARGGLRTWLGTQSITMAGNMEAGKLEPLPKPGMEAPRQGIPKGQRPHPIKNEEGKIIELPFVLEMQRPHKMRLEIQFAGDTAIQVFDGTNGWKLRPFLGRSEVEPYTADEMKSAMQQQDMEGPLMDYASKGTKLTLDGMEQVDGKNAYKLSLTIKDGQVRHVWVDAATFLDVKIDGIRNMNGKPKTVATNFRDYRSVQGLKIPYLLETSVAGIPGSEKIKVERIAINTKLDAARFMKPK